MKVERLLGVSPPLSELTLLSSLLGLINQSGQVGQWGGCGSAESFIKWPLVLDHENSQGHSQNIDYKRTGIAACWVQGGARGLGEEHLHKVL